MGNVIPAGLCTCTCTCTCREGTWGVARYDAQPWTADTRDVKHGDKIRCCYMSAPANPRPAHVQILPCQTLPQLTIWKCNAPYQGAGEGCRGRRLVEEGLGGELLTSPPHP